LYDGEWYENKMNGKGILYYASSKPAYDGDWVNDKFDGFGILFIIIFRCFVKRIA
jgi:hypothetical protein